MISLFHDADSGWGHISTQVVIAYFLHRFVLFQPASWLRWNAGQKNGQPMPPVYIDRFMGASLILIALVIVVVLALAFSLAGRLEREEFIGAALLSAGLVAWIYLSLFGMQFPAMAAGRRFSMIDPLRATWANRGRVAIAL